MYTFPWQFFSLTILKSKSLSRVFVCYISVSFSYKYVALCGTYIYLHPLQSLWIFCHLENNTSKHFILFSKTWSHSLSLSLIFSLILSLDCIFAYLISNLGREEYFPTTVSYNLKLIQSTLEEIVRQSTLNTTKNRVLRFYVLLVLSFFRYSLQLTYFGLTNQPE